MRPPHPVLREARAIGNNPLKQWAPLIGVACFVVGAVSIAWAMYGRPELAELGTRGEYFKELVHSDRVYWAFEFDLFIYTAF